MNIIFAGTPEFAVPALAALIEAGHNIRMVLTQPDRPAGRGMQLKASPVKQLALQHHLNIFQPESLKPQEVQTQIAAVQADVMIVAAYGLIIPTTILNMPSKGCYNIHASLLPRWRGAAPIHRALLAGDLETGITIMEVVPALDAGNIVCKGVLPIGDAETTQTLHDALANIGAHLMVQAMADLSKHSKLPSSPQDESLVTYAHKLEKSECPIDWKKSAIEISRQVRAFNPFPVATAQFRGETCRIWFANAHKNHTYDMQKAVRGEIVALEGSIHAACGDGVLMSVLNIHELQMPGGKRQTAQQFIQGQHVKVGECFS
jgi:methionyl-tRNA formyltransferase